MIMNAKTALTQWTAACRDTGLRWFLFEETLLCAAYYGHLPESVSCAQIAVLGQDLPALTEQVFPRLPGNWKLHKEHFGRDKRELVFWLEDTPVLDITVLYGVENEAQIETLKTRINEITHTLNRKNRRSNYMRMLIGQPYIATVGKLARRRIQRLTEQVFPRLVALAGTSDHHPPFYCDSFTSKKPVLIPGAGFDATLMLPCDGAEYPVFSGYRDYLTQVYGDYQIGLNDEIGCGLTEQEKEELKQHQLRSFQALQFLEEVSREFGLRYYLLAGSVLGAVRHGGFIPWDDDVDVGIRIEELERFEQIVKEQLPLRLPEGFALMQSGPDNPYPRMFSKICYEGRCCIDLWPLIPTYNDGFRAKFLWYFAKLITKVHYRKIGYNVTRFLTLVKPMAFLLSDRAVMALARWNERRYAGKQTPAYINLYSIYRRPKETIQRHWLDTETRAVFNGLDVPVVGCTEEYLTHLYGDYQALPAPWKRASRHSERFTADESSPE